MYQSTMSYIGIPTSIEETIYLTRNWIKEQSRDPNSIHSVSQLNTVLAMFTSLRLYCIDKNQTIFGFQMENFSNRYWIPLLSVDDAVIRMLEIKRKFKEEVSRLDLDLNHVKFTHMEEEDTIAHNPEPIFFG